MSTLEMTVSMLECMPESDQNKVMLFTRDLFSTQKTTPFHPMSEQQFLASIDKSLQQADRGEVQNADEAINEISADLGI